jgi:hypothetical protein
MAMDFVIIEFIVRACLMSSGAVKWAQVEHCSEHNVVLQNVAQNELRPSETPCLATSIFTLDVHPFYGFL